MSWKSNEVVGIEVQSSFEVKSMADRSKWIAWMMLTSHRQCIIGPLRCRQSEHGLFNKQTRPPGWQRPASNMVRTLWIVKSHPSSNLDFCKL